MFFSQHTTNAIKNSLCALITLYACPNHIEAQNIKAQVIKPQDIEAQNIKAQETHQHVHTLGVQSSKESLTENETLNKNEESPLQAPQPDSQHTVGLTELTRFTLQHSPVERASAHRIEAAKALLSRARWAPLSGFNVRAGFGLAPETRGHPIFSPDSQLPLNNAWRPFWSVQLQGVIPIYTFGKLSAAKHAAQAGIAVSQAQARKDRSQLLYQLRKAYFSMQFALDSEALLNDIESKLAKAKSIIEERIDSDELEDDAIESSEEDLFRLEKAEAELMAQRADATYARSVALKALTLITGRTSIHVHECPLTAFPFELLSTDVYQQSATSDHPELVMLQAAMDATHANKRAKEAAFLPDIGLALRAGISRAPGVTNQSNPFIQDAANFTSLGAGLVASWSLDLPKHIAQSKQSGAQHQQLYEQAQAAHDLLQLEVHRHVEEVVRAEEHMHAWHLSYQKNHAWLIAQSQGYELGTVSAKDLLEAVKDGFKSRYTYMESIYKRNLSIAALEQQIGTPIVAESQWDGECKD